MGPEPGSSYVRSGRGASAGVMSVSSHSHESSGGEAADGGKFPGACGPDKNCFLSVHLDLKRQAPLFAFISFGFIFVRAAPNPELSAGTGHQRMTRIEQAVEKTEITTWGIVDCSMMTLKSVEDAKRLDFTRGFVNP